MDYVLYLDVSGTSVTNDSLAVRADEEYIKAQDPKNPHAKFWITAKGYQRLSEIKKPSDSNQCFVAMWFADEMKDAYDKAIKPAIEFIEDGAKDPKFRAAKINDVEHINDINDEDK